MIRKVIFWSHLIIGIIAGLVVFLLCITGALLSFESQSLDWAERSPLNLPPAGVTERLPADELVARAVKVEPARTLSVQFASDPRLPVSIAFANGGRVCLNGYTGGFTGHGATALRAFYRYVLRLHTGLTLTDEGGKIGSAIIGACDIALIFLVLSGLYVWWPRKWRWSALRNFVAFRFDVRGRQRDWNWHNAFGFWSLIPLLVMSATGVLLSYRGTSQGIAAFARKYGPAPVALPAIVAPVTTATAGKPGWTQIMAGVEQNVPGWRSMLLRWPDDKQQQVSFFVFRGAPGEAQKLVFVTVNRATAAVTQLKRWENRDAGERALFIARFAHTGAIVGLPGQALAGLGCLAGVMLVYTGTAGSCRRFFGRRRRGA